MTFVNEEERYDALSGADRAISLSAKDQYFRELEWREPISNEECEKLLQRVVRGNVERRQVAPNQWMLSLAWNARERLVEVYQPLVVGLARRRVFLFRSMQLLDVIQEGNLGLLDALDSYDDEKAHEVEFAAFATIRIKRAMAAAVNERDRFLRMSTRMYDMVTRKNAVERQLRKQFGSQPSLSEIAEVMGVSQEVLDEGVQLAERGEVESLHHLLEMHDLPEDALSFESLYQSVEVVEDARQQELAATFERVFATAMPQQQREVVTLRYGFGDGATEMRSTTVVAEMMGLAGSDHALSSEREATHRLRQLVEPVTLPDGRLSCTFRDVYSQQYCRSREVAEMLGIALSSVGRLVKQGVLSCEFRSRPGNHSPGPKMRFFKRSEVEALQQQFAATPVKLSASRRESASLKQARRSASLPSIVA